MRQQKTKPVGMRKMEVKKLGLFNTIRQSLQSYRLGDLLIREGLIDENDLNAALEVQKETTLPLGKIFVQHAHISTFKLKRLLFRQFALRSFATTTLCIMSLACFISKDAQAESSIDKIVMSSISQDFNKVTAYPNLLGSSEKRDHNIQAFTKWTSMFERFDKQLKKDANVKTVQQLQSQLGRYSGHSMKQMVSGVNDMMNAKRYITDQNNWGQSDYWATPVEFLQRGGDCEDFAIAKYTALRALGMPEERLRIAIVQDTVKNVPHAVLVAYTDEGAFILDNQIKRLVDAEKTGRYRPIFSINRSAWWLHQQPETTRVASAR